MGAINEHVYTRIICQCRCDYYWDSFRDFNVEEQAADNIIKPILDFMQTMPGFVYLIPAVAFFGIGVVPGVFASVIFALPLLFALRI